jgi:hypothetical protein
LTKKKQMALCFFLHLVKSMGMEAQTWRVAGIMLMQSAHIEKKAGKQKASMSLASSFQI